MATEIWKLSKVDLDLINKSAYVEYIVNDAEGNYIKRYAFNSANAFALYNVINTDQINVLLFNELGQTVQISPTFDGDFIENEEAWQQSKSLMLKSIENVYIDFLESEWTNILRNYSIIANDFTVTADNVDSSQNMQWLLILRAVHKETYYAMAGEFERFKNTVEELGGIMAKVRKHVI